MSTKQKYITVLANNRRIIQAVIGVFIYLGISHFQVSLWWVVGVGSALGIIWGKVFCRWMCPMGFIMELMMKMSPNDSFQKMYQYHKIGCPIAWISGWLNKFSFYKIQINTDTCKNCGICDKACYITSIDKQKFSLYKPNTTNPAESFSCSKCLVCVAECPNGSLSYKAAIPSFNPKHLK
jgi:polyferredoxin